MKIPLRTEFTPATVTSREDIEAPIREALATQDRGTVTVEVPGATLTLSWCDYPDRTPIWDKPLPASLGKVTAHRPDGKEATWMMAEVPTWEALAEALADFQDGWDAEVLEALSEAAAWAQREQQIKAELQRARSQRTAAMRRAERAGVSRYRIAQATGITQAGVKKILDSRGSTH